jgi:lipopolysaccharide transport system permease protein
MSTAASISAAEPKPLLVLRPASKWAALDLQELWRFRDLVLTLAKRDITLRYRQTALGAAWVLLQPLIAAGIFTFVFGTMMGLKGAAGSPYFVFAFAGQVAWQVFQTTLSKCGNCLVGNSHLVSKVYFPRLVLPLSTVFSALIDFLVGLTLMAVLMYWFDVMPTLALLMLPVWVALLVTAAMGVGLFMSSLMVRYRDVQYVLPVMVQMLLYASPVAYALSAVPQKYRALFELNPLAGLLEGFRWSILGGEAMPWGSAAYAAGVSLLLGIFGAIAFKRMEQEFADVI